MCDLRRFSNCFICTDHMQCGRCKGSVSQEAYPSQNHHLLLQRPRSDDKKSRECPQNALFVHNQYTQLGPKPKQTIRLLQSPYPGKNPQSPPLKVSDSLLLRPQSHEIVELDVHSHRPLLEGSHEHDDVERWDANGMAYGRRRGNGHCEPGLSSTGNGGERNCLRVP